MKKLSTALFPLLALLVCLLATSGNASAARLYQPDYYNDPQQIGGWETGADGSLTPLSGSPFPLVSGPAFASSGIGSFAFTPDGSRAAVTYFFDGGVLGLRVDSAGAITRAQEPAEGPRQYGLAITPDGRFAYTGVGGPAPFEGILGYTIGADGALTPLGGGAFGTEEQFDVAVSPDGRFLFSTNLGGVSRFAINADGTLTLLGTTPIAEAFTLQTAPSSPRLFVTASNGSADGVMSFTINPDGSLTQNGDRALTGDVALGFIAVSPDGNHVYMPDSNLDGIVTVAVAPDGSPSAVGTMAAEDAESVAVSPDGRFLYWYQRSGGEIHAASIGADGLLSPLPFSTPWETGENERLVFQPQPTPVAKFTATSAAPGGTFRFNAGGSERAARYDWDFGDGAVLANGGPAPTHAYAEPGAYQVTLTVADAQGCSARQVYTGQSTVCPGGSSAVMTATADTLPVLGKPKALPKKFVPKAKGVKKGGTSFRYTVNEAAIVRFKIERKRIGRLVGNKCKPRKPQQAGKRCPLFKRVGSRSQKAKAGANKLKWNGKLKGKPLAPGSYRATVVATDVAGGRSAPKTVGFRILPLPKQP